MGGTLSPMGMGASMVPPTGSPRAPIVGPPMSMNGVGMPSPVGSAPLTGFMNANQMPHGNASMDGFGAGMQRFLEYPEVETRFAPMDRRPEAQPFPEHKKDLRGVKVDADGNRIPSGTDKLALYGALDDLRATELKEQKEKLRRRRRINAIPALLALFLPWLAFLGTYYVASFFLHYMAPFATVAINLCILIACCAVWRKAFTAWRKNENEKDYYPAYVSAACLIAVLLGWILGDYNFWQLMQPCYNVDHLASYNNVNPSTETLRSGMVIPTRGKRYQDAGMVYFDHDTVLDFNKSMSFKNGDVFCVVPIVNKNCQKNCGYDFWAVGVNCCSEDIADFRCGEFDNLAAKSGLRLTHDEQRPHFRMAVMEAEGVHQVISTHPLFFYWLHDPVKELSHMKKQGYKMYIVLMIVGFFISATAAYFGLKWARELFRPSTL
jgi:hypothetical protein